MSAEAVDHVGRHTLALVEAHLGVYNTWMHEQIAPAVRGRVLEVGSGTGTMSAFLAGAPRLALTDIEPASLADLAAKFGGREGVTIDAWDLNDPPPAALAAERFDSIVCLNVLEHIEDDAAALGHLFALLAPGGRLALLVPAHQALYNGFDRGVHHFRRYAKPGLAAKLAAAGFVVERQWYFNMLGALGWFVNGNLLGRTILPAGQLKVIDRLVPILRLERLLPRPFGLSVIAIAAKPG